MNRTTRRRVLRASATGVAIGVAGCSTDLDGGPDDDPDSGESDEPGDGEAANVESLDPPEGTSADGIDDPDLLVEATGGTFSETDYDLEQRLSVTVGGQQRTDVTQRKRSSLGDERQLLVFESAAETNHLYREGGTVYARTTSDGGTEYGTQEARRDFEEAHPPELLGGTESLGGILETGDFEPAATVRRNGRRTLRFELAEADAEAFAGSVTAASATVLVDADSVVHEASRDVELESDGETTTIEQSFVVHELGDVTVERPDWFERARDAGS